MKMKRTKFSLFTALTVLGGLAASMWGGDTAATAAPAKKGIKWQPSFAAALKEAKRTKKPIMVDFFATWCGPCKMLDEQTYKHGAVIKESAKFVSVKVDVDKNSGLAQKYGIQAMPTVAFLRPDGTMVSSFIGFQDASQTVKSMRDAHAKAKQAKKISA